MLCPTLGFTKQRFNICDGIQLQVQVSKPDRMSHACLTEGSNPLSIDHRIFLDDFPSANLVVGLGRSSNKFKGRTIALQPSALSQEKFWPMRQLANLCNVAQTRYGYILTEEEFVACCFSRQTIQEKDAWKAAVMPVPWTRHGQGQLTTDLALWWLCMLAMSSSDHRALVSDGEIVGIDEWDVVFLDDERGWVRRHRYSSHETPTPPPPPPS